MKIHIIAPEGKKLRDTLTGKEHSEVVCEEKYRSRYVVADSEDDPVVETLDGVTLEERVTDLEDAVIELAEIITEEE